MGLRSHACGARLVVHVYVSELLQYFLGKKQLEKVGLSFSSLFSLARACTMGFNSAKTKFMVPTAVKHQLHTFIKTNLVVDGKLLECFQTTKLLGLHLSEHLIWDDHKDLYLLPSEHFGYSQENKELLVNQKQGYPSFLRCVLPVCLWRKPYGYSLIRLL